MSRGLDGTFWEPNPVAERMERATREVLTANQRAFLLSLTPSGEVLEAAAKAAYDEWREDVGHENYPEWDGLDALSKSRWVSTTRAAAPLLLADKEREIELARAERDRQYDETVNQIARVGAAESRVAALEGALGPDLAGRSFADLLDQVAVVTEAMGGGPMTDCLKDKAQRIRTLLDGGTR